MINVLGKSLVFLRNWNSSQNSLISSIVATSLRLLEYSYALTVSISWTQKVKAVVNLKLVIINIINQDNLQHFNFYINL